MGSIGNVSNRAGNVRRRLGVQSRSVVGISHADPAFRGCLMGQILHGSAKTTQRQATGGRRQHGEPSPAADLTGRQAASHGESEHWDVSCMRAAGNLPCRNGGT